eukprot:TRINITY_DN64843_c0_g1_i1.p1 TRINITY_DN64843_c0_g1~~TRINITY_DN64843_c0_g1_i1.p1  ORF type:complete len:328 (+),score=48.82 TRINITY_DN64843_c0_g1_i1:222-1205(+)
MQSCRVRRTRVKKLLQVILAFAAIAQETWLCGACRKALSKFRAEVQTAESFGRVALQADPQERLTTEGTVERTVPGVGGVTEILSSPLRRTLLGLVAAIVVLATNTGGITGFLLSVVPGGRELAKELRLDAIFSFDGLKTYYGQLYRVRYPENWVAVSASGKAALSSQAKVVAAWSRSDKPQKSAARRTDILVEVQSVAKNVETLEALLGKPREALSKLLDQSPEKRDTDTVSVFPLGAERVARADQSYYRFEWRTEFKSPYGTASFSRRGYAALALGVDVQGQRSLYTLSYSAPERGSSDVDGQIILDGFEVEAKAQSKTSTKKAT